MSLLIDQSWTREWVAGQPDSKQRDAATQWLRAQPSGLHPVLMRFPPLCVVQSTQPQEVPYPYTVGIVNGYNPDGTLAVSQEPGSPPVPCNPDTLRVVSFWKGLNPATVDFLLRH